MKKMQEVQSFDPQEVATEFEHHKGKIMRTLKYDDYWDVEVMHPSGEVHELYIDETCQVVRMVKHK